MNGFVYPQQSNKAELNVLSKKQPLFVIAIRYLLSSNYYYCVRNKNICFLYLKTAYGISTLEKSEVQNHEYLKAHKQQYQTIESE